MARKKLTPANVQHEFNRAIVRRDRTCAIPEPLTPCAGGMQCSHFFPVGGNSCLRFYPLNAFCQCASHHLAHHNRNPAFYHDFMEKNYSEELAWMESVRGRSVKYSQPVLRDILDMCKNDRLDELKLYIRGLF